MVPGKADWAGRAQGPAGGVGVVEGTERPGLSWLAQYSEAGRIRKAQGEAGCPATRTSEQLLGALRGGQAGKAGTLVGCTHWDAVGGAQIGTR